MRGLVLTAFVSLVVVAAATGAPQSGIKGIVERGPVKPVCEESVRCVEPAPGVVLVFSKAGLDVARATTSKTGAYRVALPPGWYRVRSLRKYPLGGFRPRSVRVVPGRYTTANFAIDTGIRRASPPPS